LKPDLAPKYTQSIGQSYILWFERSNTYVVISKATYIILNLVLKSSSLSQFEHDLIRNNIVEKKCSKVIYDELNSFLTNSNTTNVDIFPDHINDVELPDIDIQHFYKFGNKTVEINFGSQTIEQLFHPQLAHCLIKNYQSKTAVFDIFKIDNSLYLFQNKKFVFRSTTKDYHVLQGRFALELTNVIHNKESCNWLSTFHASTICNTNEAVMLIGDSGNGKSTLSAILMANGLDLLSDDFTPLYYDDTRLYRYPAAISIKKGAFNIIENEIEEFKTLPTYFNGPKNINIKYVPPSEGFKTSKDSLPCRKIVFVKYDKGCSSSFKKVSEEIILKTLIPDAWISPKPEHAKQFLNWLSNVEFYELQYSDNHYATQSLNKLINN
jgi:hypothetical protein